MDEENKKIIGNTLKKFGELFWDKPSEKALLTEYQVCEQDNDANSQAYWTLASIFIGLSTALLGGLVYGLISNHKLLTNIVYWNEDKEMVVVFVIAILFSTAMITIMNKLTGWLKRIQFYIILQILLKLVLLLCMFEYP